ncbi:MAG TPA: hypothetical protein DCX14_02775 [Flavobacteriales bacterium]|nr:hypothetical protein [Flavobacteriales bacterium]
MGDLSQPMAIIMAAPIKRIVEYGFIRYGLDVLQSIEVSSCYRFEDSLYSDTQLYCNFIYRE